MRTCHVSCGGSFPNISSVRYSSKDGPALGMASCYNALPLRDSKLSVTADRNLEFQQNLAGVSLAIIVLVAPSNALEDLLPLIPALLRAICEAEPGKVRRVVTS